MGLRAEEGSVSGGSTAAIDRLNRVVRNDTGAIDRLAGAIADNTHAIGAITWALNSTIISQLTCEISIGSITNNL